MAIYTISDAFAVDVGDLYSGSNSAATHRLVGSCSVSEPETEVEEIVVQGKRVNEVDPNASGGSGGWVFDLSGIGLAGSAAIFHFGEVIQQMLTQDSDGDGISDLLDSDITEIVVTASPDQVAAAKAHYDSAFAEVTMYGLLVFAGAAYATGPSVAVPAAGGGYLEGRLGISEAITNTLADGNYWTDYYEDGRWDGYIQPRPPGGGPIEPWMPF